MFLGLGDFSNAGGAGLLYLTNLSAIVFAAAVMYLISGFTPLSVLAQSRRRIRMGLFAAALSVSLVMIPLTVNGIGLLNDTRDELSARSTVEDWLGEDTALEIFSLDVTRNSVDLTLAGPEEPPTAEVLAEDLAIQLGDPLRLRVRWAPVTEQQIEVAAD